MEELRRMMVKISTTLDNIDEKFESQIGNLNQKLESQIGNLNQKFEAQIASANTRPPRDRPEYYSPTKLYSPTKPKPPESDNLPRTAETTTRFRPQDIGYFDPNSDGPAFEVKDGKNIYHRVVGFVNRIRVCVANSRDNGRLLAENLDTCLLGTAHAWYNRELSQTTHAGLRTNPQLWYVNLESRFRESPAKSQARCDSLRYTTKDASIQKDPEEYFQDVIENGSNAGVFGYDNDYAQCIFAWRRLAPELRISVPEPIDGPNVRSGFLRSLSSAKDIWFDLYAKKAVSFSTMYPSRTNRYNRNPALPYSPALSPRFANSSSPANSSNPENPQGPYNPPAAPPFPKTPLLRAPTNPPSSSPFQPRNIATPKPQGNPNVQNPLTPTTQWRPQYQRPQFQRVYGYDIDGNTVELDPATGQTLDSNYADNGNSANSAYLAGYDNGLEASAQWSSEDLRNQEEATEDDNTIEANIAYFTQPPEFRCRLCQEDFGSNNKLHRHLKSHFRVPTATALAAQLSLSKQPSIIQSDSAKPLTAPGYAFTGYKFATAKCQIGDGEFFDACLDTGCTATLADADFVKSLLPDLTVHSMTTMLNVRGIGSQKHLANRWVLLKMKFLGLNKQILEIEREVHLVDNLKAKLLIGIDILHPEGIIINLLEKTATFTHCRNTQVPLTIVDRNLRKTVFTLEASIIPPHSRKAVSIRGSRYKPLDLPSNRRLLFEPTRLRDLGVMAHLVDETVSSVFCENNTSAPIKLPKGTKLGEILDYDNEGEILTSHTHMAELAVKPPSRCDTWIRRAFKAMVPPSSEVAAHHTNSSAAEPTPDSLIKEPLTETVLPNGITLYGNPAPPEFLKLIEAYPDLWNDKGNVAKIPEKDWMEIPLVDNWRDIYKPGQARVYQLSSKDRAIVDVAFDKLHEQGRMSWTKKATPFSFPVFVVWRTMPDGSRKGRAVVDIRALNKITLPDAYPVPSQADILAAVKGSKFITTIDCASFFYQFLVKHSHRYRLTVASHRGQETSNVAIIGYRNSPAYVQRIIDGILRPYRSFARAYVDDIVIFSRSQNDHLSHLTSIFRVLAECNICLAPKKCFIGYPNVALLGQRVDALGLSTPAEKLAAIQQLAFPKTLADLEMYLGLTGYLRQYVSHYTAIAQPLQDRKTYLLSTMRDNTSNKNRKGSTRQLLLENPTPAEMQSYRMMQDMFSQASILVHFDPLRQLYIDMDASKQRGFGAYLYHIRDEKEPLQKNQEPILFLSRALSVAEKNYWPTELEVAGLVWVIKKVRHMVESSKKPTIVFTDHAATVQIAKQSSLNTTSIDKLNLRLVRASEYLQRFPLDIHHKQGKANIVPDALSRLPIVNDTIERLSKRDGYQQTDELEEIAAYPATFINMSDDFRSRLLDGYSKDERWARIRLTIEANNARAHNAIRLPYCLVNDLIYFNDPAVGLRLCIPRSLYQEIFNLAHDLTGHQGYERCRDRLQNGVFLHNMSKELKAYILHCPDCQVYRTYRHKPYGTLQPIISAPQPFHTLTLDFVLGLPVSSPDGFDNVMSVTDKFSKAITLLPGKTTWDGKQWAEVLVERLSLLSWGIPAAIISDRDSKFTGQFWKAIFNALQVNLLFSAAWHPQTDGMSEATNQIVEIALRYHISHLSSIKLWPTTLAKLSFPLNNSLKSATTKTPTEVLFGFRVRESLDLFRLRTDEPTILPALAHEVQRLGDDILSANPVTLTEEPNPSLSAQQLSHLDARDAISFAAMSMKAAYDSRHKPMFFDVGDKVFLSLRKGYRTPGVKHIKFQEQRSGPFTILERIGKLAYRLELTPSMKIHDVVSVAQLEPAPDPARDPYNRPSRPPPEIIDGEEEFEVDRIIAKRFIKRGRSKRVEYLVRWKNYNVEHDTWEPRENLKNAMERVKAFEENETL